MKHNENMSFIDNLRKMFQPTTDAKAPTVKDEKKQEYTPVYGFEQDKENYTDTSKTMNDLQWRRMKSIDNDTGKELSFAVGYTNDGKIGAAGYVKDDGNIDTYRTVNGISQFFKDNFNRDTGNYTIFDANEGDDDKTWLVFDTESDGEFIPSKAVGVGRSSQPLRYSENKGEGEYKTMRDEIKRVRKEQAANRGLKRSIPDKDKLEAAKNGTWRTFKHPFSVSKNEYDDFTNNRNSFTEMMRKWTSEDDPEKRSAILDEYEKKYGFNNNPIFDDLIIGIRQYDWGNQNDYEGHEDAFTKDGRQEWFHAYMEDLDAAADTFNPYRRA